ncbi:MAG: Lrp/AsnC family transcriptional regulator [Magnetovibrionaceae bacterium]
MTEALDSFDRKILERLQMNARETAEVMSEAVGLSPAACQRRVKKLRDKGVVKADIAVLDPARIGGRLTLHVSVVLERGGAHVIDEFKRQAINETRVQQCFYVTGDADFILVVTALDMADYEAFTRRFFFGNSNIQRFTTTVAMETVKAGLALPI